MGSRLNLTKAQIVTGVVLLAVFLLILMWLIKVNNDKRVTVLDPEVANASSVTLVNLSESDRQALDTLLDRANNADDIEKNDTPPVIGTTVTFPVTGTPTFESSGNVVMIRNDFGVVMRYEDLEMPNIPDVRVILSKDVEGMEFVDLGPARGNKGAINYPVPDNVNTAEYRYVMHWYLPLGIMVNYAAIDG